jgi:hypothetical protein
MALTQSAWTEGWVNGIYTAICTVISTTAENDAYTLKTPANLDGSKPWTLFYKASGTPDGSALPLQVAVGHSDNFAITGDGATIGATDGSLFKQVMDDVVLAVSPLEYSFNFNPSLGVADVVTVAAIATGLKANIPIAPYYAFNLNGASTLNAVTHTFKITQKLDVKGVPTS